ncbi:MAG: sigma-70 family RNA polymerase sigma factor [Cyanobacteria bacterium SBLK]|nr:sigma-70 family RNA polymerase sigma factor [Cyanobacteria bacterium SBLK]
MQELDDRLKRLALQAQNHPPKSPQRQKTVDRLLREIQASGCLCRPSVPGHLRGAYEEIYAIAVQNIFRYLYENIDRYDPEKEVLQWANFLLRKRFPDAIREITKLYRGVRPTQLQRLTLEDWDRIILPESENVTSPEIQEICQYLQEDPENIFRSTCIGKNPAASFQYIALQVLAGRSWREISTELGLKIPTLSGFYQRSLKKFAPKFKEYLS